MGADPVGEGAPLRAWPRPRPQVPHLAVLEGAGGRGRPGLASSPRGAGKSLPTTWRGEAAPRPHHHPHPGLLPRWAQGRRPRRGGHGRVPCPSPPRPPTHACAAHLLVRHVRPPKSWGKGAGRCCMCYAVRAAGGGGDARRRWLARHAAAQPATRRGGSQEGEGRAGVPPASKAKPRLSNARTLGGGCARPEPRAASTLEQRSGSGVNCKSARRGGGAREHGQTPAAASRYDVLLPLAPPAAAPTRRR